MTERRRPPSGTGEATANAMRMNYFLRKHQASAKPIEVYYMARGQKPDDKKPDSDREVCEEKDHGQAGSDRSDHS